MKVRFLEPMAGLHKVWATGEVHEIEDGLAKRLIKSQIVTEELESDQTKELKEQIAFLKRELAKKSKK